MSPKAAPRRRAILAAEAALSEAEIESFVERHGLPPGAVAELRVLLSRSSTTSVLTSLGNAPAPVTLAPDEPTEETEERTPVDPRERYERLGMIGVGGMGEVWRVRDRDLNRAMAMKVMRAELMQRPAVLERFIEEAQCSAQLQHPGIVPVHELGRLPDGRLYFTMREVRGRTLHDAIAEVHKVSRDRWETGATGWTFRRLIDALHRACEAVAYAHARGVVHRDLKPDNVMLGGHGEVLVVDWGLAKVLGRRDLAAEAGDLDPVMTDRSADASKATVMGVVAGTPAYMPPEQARGEIHRIDTRSDVYALGAILYEILSGWPPYAGASARAVLDQVLAGAPAPVAWSAGARATFSLGFDEAPAAPPLGRRLPPELVAACEKAMGRDPADRYTDAGELAAEIGAWLEGARRREQALDVLARAEALRPEAAALTEQAAKLRKEAALLLAEVKTWEPEERKAPGWAKEDAATELEARVKLLRVEAEQTERAALQTDPLLPEAHAALCRRYLAAHAEREAARGDAARLENLLCRHAEALPPEHPVRARVATYLRGDGALTLWTDPAGAEVLLHRYETRNRRLVPVFERALGRTPLRSVTLPMGSYLCVLRHPERAEVRYPVCVGRGEHCDGVAPGERAPRPVLLPRAEELGPDDCYVPAGWFWSDGDPEAADGMPRRRLWCDGMVFRRFQVTYREYLAFLNDLVAGGREDEALRWVLRENAGSEVREGAMILDRLSDGRFAMTGDMEGAALVPEWPVQMVDFGRALAYGRWFADRTRLPWRLPAELEWEKAARGVDGRIFPWGDVLDGSWSCWRDSREGRPLPAVVDSFPVDESVFGVRGMAGNLEEWCADPYLREGPASPGNRVTPPATLGGADPDPSIRRPRRGGAYFAPARLLHLANRYGFMPVWRNWDLGFRLMPLVPRWRLNRPILWPRWPRNPRSGRPSTAPTAEGRVPSGCAAPRRGRGAARPVASACSTLHGNFFFAAPSSPLPRDRTRDASPSPDASAPCPASTRRTTQRGTATTGTPTSPGHGRIGSWQRRRAGERGAGPWRARRRLPRRVAGLGRRDGEGRGHGPRWRRVRRGTRCRQRRGRRRRAGTNSRGHDCRSAAANGGVHPAVASP